MGLLFTFFASTLGRYVGYALLALVLAGGITGAYFGWKHLVKAEALAEYNQKQLEKVVEDQKKYIDDLEALKGVTKELSDQFEAEKKALDEKLQGITDYLESPEAATSDKPAGDVLKEVIKRLGGLK